MNSPKFSIVTPNRDRLETLHQVMPSWQRCPDVADIVIVDFGSREPIRRTDFAAVDKVHIVRVANADSWRIGLAINIGVDFSNCEFICKLDSDIEIRDGSLFSRLSLTDGFYRGRAGSGVSHGQTCFHKSSWSRVGGYNEWLSGYGFDDSDFYQRLRLHGFVERSFDADSFAEIVQTAEVRAATEYHTELLSLTFPDAATRLTYMESRNTYLAMMRPWSPQLRRPYTARRDADGIDTVVLQGLGAEYRWAEALASFLAVVRVSGTPQNVNLLNALVRQYLADVGGF